MRLASEVWVHCTISSWWLCKMASCLLYAEVKFVFGLIIVDYWHFQGWKCRKIQHVKYCNEMLKEQLKLVRFSFHKVLFWNIEYCYRRTKQRYMVHRLRITSSYKMIKNHLMVLLKKNLPIVKIFHSSVSELFSSLCVIQLHFAVTWQMTRVHFYKDLSSGHEFSMKSCRMLEKLWQWL